MEAQTTVSQASVESVMRAVRQRLKARIALCRQVQALGKGPCNCHRKLFDIAVLVKFLINLVENASFNSGLEELCI